MSGEIDTRPGEAAILRELDHFRDEFREHRDHVNEQFDEVKGKQDLTNGRVRRVEVILAGAKGVIAFLVLITPFLVVYLSDHF